MTTVGNVVERARRMLRGSKRETFNILDTDLIVGATTLKCRLSIATLGKVAIGDVVGVGPDIMLVTDTDAANQTFDVTRGLDGTTTAVTIPAGTVIEVNWRWFTADLVAFAGDELRSWPVGVFKVASVPATVGVSFRHADLALIRFAFPLRARYQRDGTREWVDIPSRQWRIEQGLPTPADSQLIVSAGYTGSVVVEYAQALDLSAVGDPDTTLASIGLNDTLVDALLYGIGWRAAAPEEFGRADRTSQPEPRTADEVKAGDALRNASAYKALRDMRLAEEMRRLRNLYPPKF